MASQTLAGSAFALSQTIAPTKATLLAYIFPPFACQYLMAVLVQLGGTRTYRMAFLPITLYLAWRATFVDMSGGDPMKAGLNVLLITQMCSLATRCAVWAFARFKYRRHSPVDKRNESDPDNIYTACWNSWDLLLDVRGIGWNWSRGLVVPKPMFETDSRVTFVLLMAICFAFHAFALDACAQIIRVLSPQTFGSPRGGSLFDNTLPPFLEYARAILVSCLTAAAAYFGLQHSYHLLAILCVILFRHHPSQWPPLFDGPLFSTSLTQLWGRRWHQLMRDSVLNLGYRPLKRFLGPIGGMFGAFLVSAIFHSVDLGRRGNLAICVYFYLTNAFGVVLERVWQKATGKPMGGILGWMWMSAWLLISGVPMVDAYAKAGRLSALGVIGGIQPAAALAMLVYRVFHVEVPYKWG